MIAIPKTKKRPKAKLTVGKNGLPVLPDAGKLDFTDGRELEGYSLLTLAMMNRTNALVDPSPENIRQSAPYIDAARSWLDEVDVRMDEIPATELTTSLSAYDTFHRLLRHSRMPGETMEYVNGRILRAIQSRDRRIDEGQFVLSLQEWLKEARPIGAERYVRFIDERLRQWHGEALDYCRNQEATSPETIHKVLALLSFDLSSFDSSEEIFKKMLALRYSDCFDDLSHSCAGNLTGPSSDGYALKSLHRLLPACARWCRHLDKEDLDARLRRLLAWSPTLHPFASEAYRQDLSFRQANSIA